MILDDSVCHGFSPPSGNSPYFVGSAAKPPFWPGAARLLFCPSLIVELERGADGIGMAVGAGREGVLLLADPVGAVHHPADTKALPLVDHEVVRVAVRANHLAQQSRLARLAQLGMDHRVQSRVRRLAAVAPPDRR